MQNYVYPTYIVRRDAVPFSLSVFPRRRHSSKPAALPQAVIGKRLWLSVAAVDGKRRHDAGQRSAFERRTVAVASEAQL